MVYRFTRVTEGVTSLNMYKGLTHWFTGLLGSLGLLWVSVTMNAQMKGLHNYIITKFSRFLKLLHLRGYPLITLAYEGGGRGQENANIY